MQGYLKVISAFIFGRKLNIDPQIIILTRKDKCRRVIGMESPPFSINKC